MVARWTVGSLFPKSWPPGPSSAQPALAACTASHHIPARHQEHSPSLAFAQGLYFIFLTVCAFLHLAQHLARETKRERRGIPKSDSLSPAAGWIIAARPAEITRAVGRWVLLEEVKPEENPEMWWPGTAPHSNHSPCFGSLFPHKCCPLQQRCFSHWGWYTATWAVMHSRRVESWSQVWVQEVRSRMASHLPPKTCPPLHPSSLPWLGSNPYTTLLFSPAPLHANPK